jgi:hypothetical protein
LRNFAGMCCERRALGLADRSTRPHGPFMHPVCAIRILAQEVDP